MNKDVADKATRKSRLPTNLPTENEVIRKTIKRRPARKQVEEGEVEKKAPEQSGQTYNHWYHKWAGGDKYDSYNAKTKSQTRCNIELDMGYTRADTAGNPYCCLFFARGCCPKGSDCSYLHRLPPSDLVLPDASLDVFGREKWSDYRDDMGGVGSFGRQNRTLYVGKIAVGNNMEGILLKHFDEWGDIERIKLLHSRGVGFVTYFSELSAQFAKESMMNQSLDNDEVLNVRWATEDPNPKAKVYEYERLVELGKKGIGSKLTPEFIDAVRRMDELEGLVKERGYDPDDVRAIEGSSSTNGKRPAIEDGPANGDGPSADRAQASKKSRTDNGSTTAQAAAAAVAAPVKAPSQAKGLLSGSALDSLKKAAALRKLKQQKAAEATAEAAK